MSIHHSHDARSAAAAVGGAIDNIASTALTAWAVSRNTVAADRRASDAAVAAASARGRAIALEDAVVRLRGALRDRDEDVAYLEGENARLRRELAAARRRAA